MVPASEAGALVGRFERPAGTTTERRRDMEISEFSSFYVRGAGPGKGWFGEYGHISGCLTVEAGDGSGGRIQVDEKHDIRTVDAARREFKRIVLDAENHLCPFCSTWDCDETCAA